ncbi:WRKY domain containing protein [Parasponia andersonii]|uniref:WRKY domain containing protein n=1 Tax=Parasponia andersonii TaxID=3476 RepID=A0A2P5CAY3_PARAD|nr:WRKY domain containing protein [Parasponia andersonii]
MAEGWDLYAVVRSCKSTTMTMPTTTTAASTSVVSATTDPTKGGKTTSSEETLSCLASLTFEEENNPFSFPDTGEPRTNAFQELQEFYIPFFSNNPTTIISGTSTTRGISDVGGSSSQPRQQVQYDVLRQQLGPQNDVVGPQFFAQPYVSGFGGLRQKRHQFYEPNQNNQFPQPGTRPLATSTLPLPPLPLTTMPISETPRPRKRKNQQKRMVCHVPAENLSTDLWAWRKYGQKPIKGSSYPRNYYRCSSSKGCAARKQVERSNTDVDTFIVTYTGDHTHPRPTHRNSLFGSTHNRLSPVTIAAKHDSLDHQTVTLQSAMSLSTTTPVEQTKEETNSEKQLEDKCGGGCSSSGEKQVEDSLMEEELMDLENEDDQDDDVLIPNMSLSDDFFLGLKEFDYSPPGAAH